MPTDKGIKALKDLNAGKTYNALDAVDSDIKITKKY